MKFSTYLGILAVALSGCSSSEGPDANGQTGLAAECRAPCKAPQLVKRVFLLESAQGFEPLAGSTVSLSFRDGSLGVSAGCNSLGGEFSLDDGHLVLAEGGITERGCDPAPHAQDEWLWAFIQARPQLELEGTSLTLTGASAVLAFRDREVADPDRPLVATPWTIDTFFSSDAASNLPLSSDPTFVFAADGNLQFDTTCNSGTGKYTVAGNQITLSTVDLTLIACGGASAFAENHILKVLTGDGPLTFEIEAKRLTLMRGKLGLGATTP